MLVSWAARIDGNATAETSQTTKKGIQAFEEHAACVPLLARGWPQERLFGHVRVRQKGAQVERIF